MQDAPDDGGARESWQRALERGGIVIDRSRGSAHPRFPAVIYPLDYGFIPGTVGGDGAPVDIFVGSGPRRIMGALETRDPGKHDIELKLLVGTTENETAEVVAFLHGLGLEPRRVF